MSTADTTAAVPHHGMRAWMLRQVMSPLQCGTLTIVTPDGTRATRRTDAPGPDATLVLHRWRTLRRLLFDGDVGFAEAYIDGDWSSPDVSAVIEIGVDSRFAVLRSAVTVISSSWFDGTAVVLFGAAAGLGVSAGASSWVAAAAWVLIETRPSPTARPTFTDRLKPLRPPEQMPSRYFPAFITAP